MEKKGMSIIHCLKLSGKKSVKTTFLCLGLTIPLLRSGLDLSNTKPLSLISVK